MHQASNFYATDAIARQLCPITTEIPAGGIEVVEADNFRVQCFRAPTGTLLFVVADIGARKLDELLQQTYLLYADHVLKNPSYALDQPIRDQTAFDYHLGVLLKSYGQ